MKPKKTLYYNDELRDDFAKHGFQPKPLPTEYDYAPTGLLWRALSFFVYRILAIPVGWIASRLIYGVRVKNRRALKQVKGSVFIYINHTQSFHDAYMPLLLAHPRKNYVLVSPAAVSIPVARKLVPLLGGIPVPDSLTGMRRFVAALGRRSAEGAAITVYPEAHIWPFYTGVRPFPDTSFGYPVRLNTPVFAAATTYRRRRLLKNARPLINVTVSGPFYPDPSLPEKRARAVLREQVYTFIKQTVDDPDNAAYYEYKKKTEEKTFCPSS